MEAKATSVDRSHAGEGKVAEGKEGGGADDYFERKSSFSKQTADDGAAAAADDLAGQMEDLDVNAAAEAEAKRKKADEDEGNVGTSESAEMQAVASGFTINSMNMRNAQNGRVMWESGTWGREMFEQEMDAHVPRSILKCKAVSREINFTSLHEMKEFRLVQKVFFQGHVMEEWRFDFGFVIPGSTNSWQQVIKAADEMMDPELLTGNITIETSFFDGASFIAKSLVRIFYD